MDMISGLRYAAQKKKEEEEAAARKAAKAADAPADDAKEAVGDTPATDS
jgi:hypothetical protein